MYLKLLGSSSLGTRTLLVVLVIVGILGIATREGRAVVEGILLEVLDEFVLGAAFLILDGCALGVTLEPNQSREPLNINTFHINLVGSSIHLGNNKVGQVLDSLTELVVDRLKILAVSAPGGVELYKDILSVVQDDIGERLTSQDGHGASSVLGHRLLRLQGRGQLASKGLLDEGLDILGVSDITGHGVFLHGTTSHVSKDASREVVRG